LPADLVPFIQPEAAWGIAHTPRGVRLYRSGLISGRRRRETSFSYLLWSRGNSGIEGCIEPGPSSAARQENNKFMHTIWPATSNTLGCTGAASCLAVTGGFLPATSTKPCDKASALQNSQPCYVPTAEQMPRAAHPADVTTAQAEGTMCFCPAISSQGGD